jgi:hypothetical protein
MGSFGWRCLAVYVLFSFFSSTGQAQTGGKYDFYRYPQKYALSIDPLGQWLGRVSARLETRLDPNFTRQYEIVYQRNVQNKTDKLSYPEAAYTVGAIERIYLVDNAALLGQYAGIGIGVGVINKTIAVRLTAEMGYKFAFPIGRSYFFIEPTLLMDSYLITNHDARRIFPYIAMPFGYCW